MGNIEIIILLAIVILIIYIIRTIKSIKYKLYVGELNHDRYKIAIEALNGAVWQWHSDTKLLYLSKRLRGVLETEEIIDTFEKMKKYIKKDEISIIENFFDSKVKNKIEESFKLEITLVTTSGREINFQCNASGKVIENNIYYLSGVIIDITEKKKMDEIIKANEKNYRLALEGSQDLMFYCNLDKDEFTFNNRIEELLELPPGENHYISIKEWIDTVVYNEDKDIFYKEYEKLKTKVSTEFFAEYRVWAKNGKLIWVNSIGKVLEEDGEVNLYGSIKNINDRKEKELQVYYMGHYDEITGVPNRRYFQEKATEILKENNILKKKVAIIFIDMDNFKFVNDTYGHPIGDEILKMFCSRLQKNLNKDSILARFGGDEFIICQRNIKNEEEVKKLLNKIIKEQNKPFLIEKREIFLTASIGVSLNEGNGDDYKTSLKHADIAMYRAKGSGKNQFYFFNKEMERQLAREFELNAGLRKAITEKEIFYKYQPKYYCKSKKIQGVECLARWESKTLGNIPPSEFIPLAESTGMIVDIGRVLMEDAFNKLAEIKDKINFEFKISINLSQVQIQESGLIQFIKDRIKFYNIEPKFIEFEITESAIMKNPSNSINVLKELKRIGFSISLDDFGTGYSSLNYLKIIPLDVVKIDKSFIDDIGIDNRNECIIEKIIELSHALNLKVVAEGVENKEQVEYLERVQCDILQGYYFSKPLEYNELLQKTNVLH